MSSNKETRPSRCEHRIPILHDIRVRRPFRSKYDWGTDIDLMKSVKQVVFEINRSLLKKKYLRELR